MPTKPVHAFRRLTPGLVDGMSRKRWLVPGRIGRVLWNAGNTNLAFDLLVEGDELLIAKWPIIGDPVERPRSEV